MLQLPIRYWEVVLQLRLFPQPFLNPMMNIKAILRVVISVQ